MEGTESKQLYRLTPGQSMAYKIVLLSILAIVTVLMFRLALSGRTMVLLGRSSGAIDYHQLIARTVLFLMTLFVLLVELRVRLKGGSQADTLFWAHLFFALGFFVLLVLLNFWFNGVKSTYHPALAYPTLFLFLGTLATGIPMILQRF